MTTPLVSAIIPNFNNADRIGLTFEAIEKADYKNIEVLVADDASTDNSRDVIEEWSRRLPNCRAFFYTENRGVDAVMNGLLREARGDYVYFRGSDDIDRHDFVARSVAMLEAHPEAALCCADIRNFHDKLDDGFDVTSSFSNTSRFLAPDELAAVIRQRQILGYTAIVRRLPMIGLGGFEAQLKWTSDLLSFLVLGFRHGICYIPESLVYRRLDRGSFSARGSTDISRLKEVLKKFLQVLTTHYPDVCGRFIKSGWLGYFGPVLAEVVFENPELQTPTVLLLVQRNLWLWNRTADSVVEPVGEHIEAILQRNRGWLTAERGLIAVYGAGRHSEVLMSKWQTLGFPQVSHFITTAEPDGLQFAGRPVYSITSAHTPTPDLIVLSSQSFENEMAGAVRERFPQARVLAFWNPSLTRGRPQS